MRGFALFAALLDATSAFACSLPSSITWAEHAATVTAVNHVGAVLQAVCLLLSFKIYRWAAAGPTWTVASGFLMLVHPGLYVSAHQEWYTRGDCDGGTMEIAFLLLLGGLMLLAFQHDWARKVVSRTTDKAVESVPE